MSSPSDWDLISDQSIAQSVASTNDGLALVDQVRGQAESRNQSVVEWLNTDVGESEAPESPLHEDAATSC
jgi:hypothetical protein